MPIFPPPLLPVQVMGIAVFSSQLDAHFNSVRGVAFCKHLMAAYPCGIFDIIVRHKSCFDISEGDDEEGGVGEGPLDAGLVVAARPGAGGAGGGAGAAGEGSTGAGLAPAATATATSTASGGGRRRADVVRWTETRRALQRLGKLHRALKYAGKVHEKLFGCVFLCVCGFVGERWSSCGSQCALLLLVRVTAWATAG